MAAEGVLLPLAGGETRVCRFSSRAIIRIENTWGSYLEFLDEFEKIPMNTLAWVLLACCPDVAGEDQAIDLLDGTDWPALKRLVLDAWDQAHLPPSQTTEPDPTEGQKPPPR
jgi:hypothetical protein